MYIPKPKPLPSGSYRIQITINGERMSITRDTEQECYTEAMALKTAELENRETKKAQGKNLTLSQAINNYIEIRTNTLSPSTIGGYKYIQKYRFKSVMQKKLAEISDWQKVCNLEAKSCSAKTLKNAWGFVASVLSENGITPPKITLPQIVSQERPWLEPEQIKTFVGAVKGKPCEIGALLALHSLRRSEILGLTWDKVNLKKGTIRVEGASVRGEDGKLISKPTNKNSSSRRTVPIMIPALSDALNAAKDKNGRVVNCSVDVLRRQINKVCAENNLPQVGVHGLRHSFASLAYHLGMPEKECMLLGGWSDNQTMHKIYTHLSEYDVTKYAKAMQDFYK